MPVRSNLFAHTLSHLEYGKTNNEIDNALNDAIIAAQQTGKTSSITVTLTIKPKNNGDQVFITPDVKSKIPKFSREETIFFPTDGNLLRNDPRQQNITGMKIVEDIMPADFKQAI